MRGERRGPEGNFAGLAQTDWSGQLSGYWGGIAPAAPAGLSNVIYTVSSASPSNVYNAAQLKQGQ